MGWTWSWTVWNNWDYVITAATSAIITLAGRAYRRRWPE